MDIDDEIDVKVNCASKMPKGKFTNDRLDALCVCMLSKILFANRSFIKLELNKK